MTVPRHRFNVLSLSGGGYRGLFTAEVLAKLEQQRGINIAACFDLVAGTSVGGLIALAISRNISARIISDAIEQLGSNVFKHDWLPRPIQKFKHLFTCRYHSESLRSAIEHVLGATTTLSDCTIPVIIPTVCLTLGRPHVFRSGYSKSDDETVSLAELALATAAAPTYLPVAEINGAHYADGGLVANAPDLLALHDALYRFGYDRKDVYLLSIGTTDSLVGRAPSRHRNLGLLGWMSDGLLMDAIMSGQQDIVRQQVRDALGDNYVEVNEPLSHEHDILLRLDNASKDATYLLKRMAQNAADKAAQNRHVMLMIRRAGQPNG